MKHQKGQALPLAMAALAIGVLLIVPFLSHAGTSLISSRVYSGSVTSRSASDAGVEHAIWGLTRGTLASQIPNPGDSTTYNLAEQLNGLSTTVTVTANVTGGGGGGTIDDATIDSYSFDVSYCNNPDIVHISGNIYAIAYQGVSNDGFVKTISIDTGGDIGNTTIDTLEFDTADGATPDIIRVSGNVYAVAYTGSGSDGFVKTVTIDSAGNIGNIVIDTLEFDTGNGNEPYIISVTGNYYAIAYRGPSNDGFIKTVTIDATGNIGNTVADTLEFDTSDCYQPDIEKIAAGVFAIAYQGNSGDGFVKTVSIAANGDIGNIILDSLEFDPSDCSYPDIVNVSGSVYAIAYQSTNSDGKITTLTISAAGSISNSVTDTFNFDPLNGQEPRIIYLADNIYGIVYHGPQDDGYFITLPVEATGAIPGTIIDSLEYDTSNGYFPDIIRVSEDVVAVAYCIPSTRGMVVTIGINAAPGSTAASYEIVSAAGNTTIKALVNTANTTASIVSWLVE
jgi:hypothetical protein